jgi:parallel beta-helix repeat protein
VYSNSNSGIHLDSSSNNNVTGNDVYLNSNRGIYLDSSSNNNITGNDVSSNINNGIYLEMSNDNTLKDNFIFNSGHTGINITLSQDNKIYHNKIINNNIQAYDDSNNGNRWNYTYYWNTPEPSGGNFWSDYDEVGEGCVDNFDGPVTPQIAGVPDGVCDTQYDIDADSTDYYPLAKPPDLSPPEIFNVLIDGASTKTYTMSAIPPTVTLNATVNDLKTGYSNIGGANYTLGLFNWSSSQSMNAVDGTWNDDIVESVTVTFAPPATKGTHTYCVYGWDDVPNNNTTSTACATLIIADLDPPEVNNVLIDGSATQTYMLSSLPPSITLNATVDDANTGGSNVSGANYTLGAFNWPSSQSMNPVDGTWDDDIVEPVTATITTPQVKGIYTYCVYAWDEVPNYNTTSTECAQLSIMDDLPPETHNVRVDGQASVTVNRGTIVTLTATINDTLTGGSNVSGANYTVGPGNWTGLAMTAVDLSFDNRIEDVTASVNTAGWSEGLHEIYVYGWDEELGYNTSSVAYATINITIDITPPTIDNLQPPDTSTTTDNTPMIGASYDDVSGIDVGSVELKVDGVVVTPQILTTMGVGYTPVSALSDATYNVELKVNDTYGNQATSTWTFTVDTTPPTISNLQPPDASKTNDSTPNIGADYSDLSGIDTASVVLKVDGIVVTPQTLTASGVSYTPASELSDGSHDVELIVDDMYNNQATTTWSFTVDSTPPSISNRLPSDTSKTDNNIPIISANYSDVSGINTTSVVLKVDGIAVTPQTLTATDVEYAPTSALSDGNHDIELSVRDYANNLVTETWSFMVDTTPPTANPGLNIEINVGETVNFNGDASSDNIDATTQLNYTWKIYKGGSLIATFYGIAPSYVFDVAGEYEVNLMVRDSVGNEGLDTMTVTVTEPTVSEGADYWWILLMAVVIIVVIILILLMLMRKRKKPADVPPPTPSPDQIQEVPPQEQPIPPGDVPPPPQPEEVPPPPPADQS